MRHKDSKGRKFNRSLGHRKALMRNLLTFLFRDKRLVTTLPKAKELKSLADLVISRSRGATLSKQRHVFSLLTQKSVAQNYFSQILPSFGSRTSGYSRIVKLGRRISDGSEMARIELIEEAKKVSKVKKENDENESA